MRLFKSLLVSLIGLTAFIYALQSLTSVNELRAQIDSAPGASSPTLSWSGFALITLIHFALAVTAMKGAWELFAARGGSPQQFKEAKTTAVWAGGIALLSWFALALMLGAGLFQWNTDFGEAALAKSFALATTSALTILFVWGTTD